MNKIMEKKYKLKKKAFANWMFADRDDIEYWGNRFINELIDEGEYTITLQEIFDERDDVPAHILEDYPETEDEWDDVDCGDIELID